MEYELTRYNQDRPEPAFPTFYAKSEADAIDSCSWAIEADFREFDDEGITYALHNVEGVEVCRFSADGSIIRPEDAI